MKAHLKYHQKAEIGEKLVVEIILYEVAKTKKYPDGVKYRLVCIDKKRGNKILMDNHHPKGDHIHINNSEIKYEFVDENKLINDFEKLVLEHIGVKL